MLGVYESSIKKISFETGIKRDEVEKGLKAFERVGKVKYSNNYVFLTNYMKHQNYNTNMKKSAIDVYNNLPNELKIKDLVITKNNPSEGFESLSKGLGMVRKIEVEVEREYEVEVEEEIESDIIKDDRIDFEMFWNLYDKKTSRDKCKIKWDNLKLEDQNKILEYIPKYKFSQPDKKFRKNPETFLNQKSWNDEIINSSQEVKTIKTRIGHDSDEF